MAEPLDVHVTVIGVTPDAIAVELGSLFGRFEPRQDGLPNLFLYHRGEVTLAIAIEDDVTVSVSLFGQRLWPSDPAFARHLSRSLGCRALCDPGSAFPEVDAASDVLLEVAHGRERLVTLIQ